MSDLEDFLEFALPVYVSYGKDEDIARTSLSGLYYNFKHLADFSNAIVSGNFLKEHGNLFLPFIFYTEKNANQDLLLEQINNGVKIDAASYVMNDFPFWSDMVLTKQLHEIMILFFDNLNNMIPRARGLSLSHLATHFDKVLELDQGNGRLSSLVLQNLVKENQTLPLYSFGFSDDVGLSISDSQGTLYADEQQIIPCKRTTKNVGMCPLAEKYFDPLFTGKFNTHTRYSTVCLDNVPVGIIKYNGDNSMLAIRTVRASDCYPLVTGGIYAIDNELIEVGKHKDVINVESFRARPLRFLGAYSDIVPSVSTFDHYVKIISVILRPKIDQVA